MRRARTGSQAASISEVYSISVEHTYMGELVPESLPGLGKPGQDLRVVSCWTPNDALKDTVLTSGFAEGLGNAPMVGAAGQAARARSKIQQSSRHNARWLANDR